MPWYILFFSSIHKAHSNTKRQLQQKIKNITEDHHEEKAVSTRKDTMYCNHLDRIEIHVDLPRRDYRLLPHAHYDLQLSFGRLGNDVGVYPGDK